ncbi:putative E3 ubiquitin-protein ligase RHB1A isoform X1 [Carex rostrata]
MGACCCIASGRSEPDRRHIYHLPSIEEHELLSTTNDGSSVNSNAIIVDTNLDGSTPDTFRAPPAPLPYDGGLTVQEVLSRSPDNPDTGQDLEKSDCKEKAKQMESLPLAEDEDDCPICLEEYDKENPRYFTRCEHEFHLACLLDWMERSETCPVCDQILMIEEMYQ